MSNDQIRAAVRGLRHAMNMSQTQFGALIGKSLPTIQRYETLVPPHGKILLKLESLARERRLDEYAKTFRAAIENDLGVELPEIPTTDVTPPFPVVLGGHVPQPVTPEDKMMHDALQLVLHASQFDGEWGESARKDLKLVRRGLRRLRTWLEEVSHGNQADADNAVAAIRLHRDGLSPEQISERLRRPVSWILWVLKESRKESK